MDRELNKIINLLRFTFLFKHNLYSQSPDYIIEKYDHFIGFEPTAKYIIYTPDHMAPGEIFATFFLKYYKRWKVDDSKKIDTILKYLLSSQLSFGSPRINLWETMIKSFEEYIGELEYISSEPKRGLHTNLENIVNSIISNNLKGLTPILRDLKLKSIGI